MRRDTLMMAMVTAAALGAATTTAVADPGKPLALGATAPLPTLKMKSATDGKLVSIADVKGGKGTLVVFTCNQCPFAQAWEERIVALGNAYGARGVGVLLVNANDPSSSPGEALDEMQRHAKERRMKVPYVADEGSSLARAFGASRTPEAFLFDRDGKLVYHGTIDDNHGDAAAVKKHYLKDALDAVVAGKPPATTETKAMGCGIKFRNA